MSVFAKEQIFIFLALTINKLTYSYMLSFFKKISQFVWNCIKFIADGIANFIIIVIFFIFFIWCSLSLFSWYFFNF